MCMLSNGKYNNSRIFNQRFDELASCIRENVLVVIDADETLSTKDTSRIFWENNYSKKSWLDFRANFERIGKNYDGYLHAARTYSSIVASEYVRYCKQSSKLVELRQGWDDIIAALPLIIVVTSGIRLLWHHVIVSHGWDHVHLIGGNHAYFDDYIVDPDIKLEIVTKLHHTGKKVIAFGDSRLDAPMLKEADLGIAVANERQSPGLAQCLSGVQHICQIQSGEEILPGLPLLSFQELKHVIESWGSKPISL